MKTYEGGYSQRLSMSISRSVIPCYYQGHLIVHFIAHPSLKTIFILHLLWLILFAERRGSVTFPYHSWFRERRYLLLFAVYSNDLRAHNLCKAAHRLVDEQAELCQPATCYTSLEEQGFSESLHPYLVYLLSRNVSEALRRWFPRHNFLVIGDATEKSQPPLTALPLPGHVPAVWGEARR